MSGTIPKINQQYLAPKTTNNTQQIASQENNQLILEQPKEQTDHFQAKEVLKYEQSNGVLPYEESGSIRYPKTHSVFTPLDSHKVMIPICSSAMITKYPNEYKNFLRQLKGEFVDNNLGGTVYNRGIAKTLYNAKGDENLKDLLISSEFEFRNERWGPRKEILIRDNASTSSFKKTLIVDSNGPMGSAWDLKPLHRVAKLTDDTPESKPKDFEVLMFTGHAREDQSAIFDAQYSDSSGIHSDQDRMAEDLLCIEAGLEGGLRKRCKAITNLTAPTKAEFENALKEKSESIKNNDRQLLIIYMGHANSQKPASKFNIQEQSAHKEGAQQFRIKLKDTKVHRDGVMEEDEYKELMNKYLDGTDVIHVLSGCKIGGALSAHGNEKLFSNYA